MLHMYRTEVFMCVMTIDCVPASLLYRYDATGGEALSNGPQPPEAERPSHSISEGTDYID
jgi:hypothetical protein